MYSRLVEDVCNEAATAGDFAVDDAFSALSHGPLWKPREATGLSSNYTNVSMHDLTEWSRNYFDNWGVVYPFVSAIGVRKIFEQIASEPLSRLAKFVPQADLVLVQAILSTALVYGHQTYRLSGARLPPRQLIFESPGAAIGSVWAMLSTPVTLKTLQALIAVQLFLLSMQEHGSASKVTGVIVQSMFQAGLHRCPSRYHRFSSDEILVRRSIFWTVYILDRYLSQALCIPFSIRDDDCDVCYPGSEEHASGLRVKAGKVSTSVSGSPHVGQAEVSNEHLSRLHLLARNAKVRGLLREMNDASAPGGQSCQRKLVTATGLRAEITKWQNDIEAYSDDIRGPNTILNQCHQDTLMVLAQENILILEGRHLTHRVEGTISAARMSALHSCLAASRKIIKTLYSTLTVARQHASGDGPATLALTPLLWPSLPATVVHSAHIVTVASVEGELPKPNARRWLFS